MASLSQEEARSISENVTWGHRKRFADGKVSLAYSNFLGYDKGEDGNFVVNKEEAKTIVLIYKMFLEGKSFYTIAKDLTSMGIKTPMKKDVWHPTIIESILTNEKYKGDALLQKTYTSDFLTKKHKINHGEIPQYYVTDNHEPIVSKDVFEIVQKEIKKRIKSGQRYSGVGIFGSKIICGECGSFYGAKVWHSTDKENLSAKHLAFLILYEDKYRRVIYRCNHKYGKVTPCKTPHLTEDEIKEIVVKAINKVIKNKKEIINVVETVITKIDNIDKLNDKKNKLEHELKTITDMTNELITTNKKVSQNQKVYNEKYVKYVEQYNEIKSKYDLLVEEIGKTIARKKELEKYISDLKKQKSLVKEFDNALFIGFVDYIEIYEDKKVVIFKDGKQIEIV